MPHVSEFHHHVGGLTAGAVARARAASSRAQDTFNTQFLSYWFDEGAVMAFGRADAPGKDAAPWVERRARSFAAR